MLILLKSVIIGNELSARLLPETWKNILNALTYEYNYPPPPKKIEEEIMY